MLAVLSGGFLYSTNSFADDDDDEYYEKMIKPQIITQIEQIIIEKTPVDSDGDFVPDDFDRYPGVDDFSYLTDSDKDGTVDALDKHPGENDAAYSVTDANENGIVDEIESL